MLRMLSISLAVIVIAAHGELARGEDAPVDPVARPVKAHVVRTWEFDGGDSVAGNADWQAENQCTLTVVPGQLNIESMGEDPFFHTAVNLPGGQTVVELRVRTSVGAMGSVFWTSEQTPQRGEDKRVDFELPDNGQWMVTRTRFTAQGRITDLRIDPGTRPGLVEIDWIKVIHEDVHPLAVASVRQETEAVEFQITNDSPSSVSFTAGQQPYTLAAGGSLTIDRPVAAARPLEQVSLDIQCPDWPPLIRSVWVVNPQAPCEWIDKPMGRFALSVARDGSMALIRQDDQLVTSLAPLVTRNDQLPTLTLHDQASAVQFRGDGITLSLVPQDDELVIEIQSEQPCEGPVVRAPGALQQGLFAGLEYLGRGERSSSTLDIETPEHIRFAPDPLKVTMPLMAFVTDRISVALTWDDMTLQPVYATPNFFDGTDDHRMTLQGKAIRATLRLAHDPLEESIAWQVKRKGLPEIPPAPRTPEQQRDICLAGLNGPLRSEKGWGHCAGPSWPQQPFADMASTLWRLSGQVAPFERFVMGGAHVPNGTIYFVTGNAQQWLNAYRQQVRQLIAGQQADGSYHYRGKYGRGHFEDTASGVCAFPAARLLEFAYVTGDQEALQAGLRTLEYMKRFNTPRGAQVWECALHTPDQLASAYLVWAYTRGYQLTGDQSYLQQARKWALSGLPFTYLWSCYPIMGYATPPVYGATNWVAPNWMGLPVQWVGGVYAYALTLLAPHDTTLDWNHVARGILVSAQQQQYPDGANIGLLPDSFNIRHQRRQPADINPCALVSLQYSVDGQVDFLQVARSGDTVVAAPFPVTIREGAAQIEGQAGVTYQVLINGQKLIEITSQGQDSVPLDTKE